MLLNDVERWLKQIMPWDTGAELQQFKAQTKDEKQWGNAQHIALSCKLWRIRILVRHEGFGNYEVGEEGT